MQWSVLGLLIGLAGCGSTIGAFDGLPAGADVSNAPWPRLVDTPQPPEDRLTAGNGVRAVERLTSVRSASEARLARAATVAPISDALLARGDANQSRPVDSIPPVDESGLLARAVRLQARTQIAAPAVNDRDLQARAALQLQRGSQQPLVNEADLLARAALQRQRILQQSTVNEADLLARAALQRQRTLQQPLVGETDLLGRSVRDQKKSGPVPVSNIQVAPTSPPPPVPLRPLDRPVVSSGFEERARLARERAAGL